MKDTTDQPSLSAGDAAAEAEYVGTLLELLTDAWNQWSYIAVGGRWSGGLSTLQGIEDVLRSARRIDKRGNIITAKGDTL